MSSERAELITLSVAAPSLWLALVTLRNWVSPDILPDVRGRAAARLRDGLIDRIAVKALSAPRPGIRNRVPAQ